MNMEAPGQIDFWQQSPEKQLEELRRFGEGYRGIIERALGRRGEASVSSDPVLRNIERAGSNFTEEQARRQSERNLDAAGFLKQVFTSEAHQKLIAENLDLFRLESPTLGMFAVRIAPQVMQKLRPGAQAVAAKPRGGVWFLLLQDWEKKDGDTEVFAEKYEQENIPHETHHLIWASIIGAGEFASRETDQDWAYTFQLFRDELMARAVSNGGLAGYTHIHSLSLEARAELEARAPGKADAIIQKVVHLNGMLEELNTALQQSESVSKIDLLKVAVDAQTLDGLEEGVLKLKMLCEHFPKKPSPEVLGGWGSVPT